MRIPDLVLRNPLRDGQERVEALGDAPRQAFALRLVLDVAGRHVDADEVAVYRVEGGGGVCRREVSVRAMGPNDDAELDLMVEGRAVGPDDGPCRRGQDGGGGLEEEEGLGGPRGGKFGDVVPVRMCWSIPWKVGGAGLV